MNDWIPKVGDLVTPDPSTATGPSLKTAMGQVFKVTAVGQIDMSIDRSVGGASPDGWLIDRFMPAKNQIVINILNDL